MGVEFERVEVNSREEYRSAQEPVSFEWRERHYEIVQIEDRWYEGYIDSRRVPLRYFRVRSLEGERFILRYNELFGAWGIMIPREDIEE